MTLEPPVLLVLAAVLGHVEPDEPEQLAGPQPGEQVVDAADLVTRARPDRGLGNDDRLAVPADLTQHRPEHVPERVAALSEISVDPYPGDVLAARPPFPCHRRVRPLRVHR